MTVIGIETEFIDFERTLDRILIQILQLLLLTTSWQILRVDTFMTGY